MSWTILKLFGIPIRLHFTMVLVPFLTYNLMPISGLIDVVIWASLVTLLFGSVLLHELGHSLTAAHFGIRTQDIVLTPIGGIARVTEMPKNPKQEIIIAVAGPLVSLTLAAVSAGLAFSLPAISILPKVIFEAVTILFGINLVLALFNLVPALPMDGGRVLRGVLALKRDHLTATRIAAKIGRLLAGAGLLYAVLFGHFNLGLISIFIYIAAGSEVRMAEYRAAEEAMRAQKGSYPFGFPFRMSRSYTWKWSTDNPPSGRQVDKDSRPNDTSWESSVDLEDRNPVEIQGKAEIISRIDKDK